MVKKVHKHIPYGRTYNSIVIFFFLYFFPSSNVTRHFNTTIYELQQVLGVDGEGYSHYTKGYRFSRTPAKVLEKGSKFILEFLAKAVPNIKV